MDLLVLKSLFLIVFIIINSTVSMFLSWERMPPSPAQINNDYSFSTLVQIKLSKGVVINTSGLTCVASDGKTWLSMSQGHTDFVLAPSLSQLIINMGY